MSVWFLRVALVASLGISYGAIASCGDEPPTPTAGTHCPGSFPEMHVAVAADPIDGFGGPAELSLTVDSDVDPIEVHVVTTGDVAISTPARLENVKPDFTPPGLPSEPEKAQPKSTQGLKLNQQFKGEFRHLQARERLQWGFSFSFQGPGQGEILVSVIQREHGRLPKIATASLALMSDGANTYSASTLAEARRVRLETLAAGGPKISKEELQRRIRLLTRGGASSFSRITPPKKR